MFRKACLGERGPYGLFSGKCLRGSETENKGDKQQQKEYRERKKAEMASAEKNRI
jgi:hypothetical protein